MTALIFWSDVDLAEAQTKLSGQWYCDGSKCVQEVTGFNLIPDPGFEWTAGGSVQMPQVDEKATMYWADNNSSDRMAHGDM